MWSEPQAWTLLMSRISEVVKRFLVAQVAAGAQAVQLFDSWVGVLAPTDYRQYVLPFVRDVLGAVRQTGVPVIHFGTNTAMLLEAQAEAGGTVIGVDWRIGLAEAWKRIGPGHAIQGNIDPLLLCAPLDLAAARARAIIAEAAGRPGHIFNVGHGILPSTPVEHVQAMVDLIHSIPLGNA